MSVNDVKSGTYHELDRKWKTGDRIELKLDFTLHYWVGEKESVGKVSIYRGPLLLAYDRRFNLMDPADVPSLDAHRRQGQTISWPGRCPPLLLLELHADDGRVLRLCDFASAGDGGTPYLTWLRVKGVAATPFSRTNPLRSGRELVP